VSTEILAPFQLTPSGSVAVTSDPARQARQHVTALVSTQPGERVMLPGYGVSLSALVFAPNDPSVLSVVQQDVTRALGTWEPSLTVTNVSPVPGNDPAQGQAMVNVDYVQAGQPGQPGTAVQTATVLAGGTVISNGS
jgi:phage baseplate assembly protein W